MDILVERADGVLTIAFNRPDKKNAITAAMYQTMADALVEAQGDAAVRAILIRGSAGIFSAGNDLEDFMKTPPMGEDAPVFQFLRAISSAEKPVVASVAGAGGRHRHDAAAALRSGLCGRHGEVLAAVCATWAVSGSGVELAVAARRRLSGAPLKSCCSAKRSTRAKRSAWAS